MPQGLIPVSLAAWAAGTVALFAFRPGRDTALIALIAGWALLPNAAYHPSDFGTPGGAVSTFHALAVPTPRVANKALAVGLGCLVAVTLFDWPAVRRVRPGWCDVPVVAWCVIPTLSALVNGLGPAEGLAQTRYLALAWGVPYLVGRVYLGDNESLRRWAVGLVLGGLAYVPLCLAEFAARPFLYGAVYGPHPYQTEGEARTFGFRPVVFLEHGNQLGLWMALATVAAVWLWKSGRLQAVARVPAGVIAGLLAAVLLLCQSHGAIALASTALAALAALGRWAARGRARRRGLPAWALALLVGLAFTVGVGALAVRSPGGFRQTLRGVFLDSGKGSFIWRLARYEDHLRRASERLALGRARADWSARPGGTFDNPVNLGLWFHAFGMYGAAGLAASTALFAGPVIGVARLRPARAWAGASGAAVSLTAGLLMVSLADSLLNSTVVLPVLAGAGGLNSWALNRREGDE